MRGKQLFKIILIVVLVGWAVYALWPTYRFYAMPEAEKTELMKEGKLVNMANRAIRLGLDLQGGMYLTYEIDMPALFEQKAENKDARFTELFTKAKEEAAVSTESFLTILEKTFGEAQIPLHRYWGNLGDSDKKIINDMQEESKDAISRAMEKLRNRIDQFGVSEPNIQKVRGNRILIELPGIKDEAAAKELIGRTALLEFRLLKDPLEYSEVMNKIDETLGREMGLAKKESAEEVSEEEDASPGKSQDEAVSINELFGESETEFEAETTDSVTVDKNIFQENPFYSLLRNARHLGKEVTASVDNMAAIDRILNREDIKKVIPDDAEFLWSSEPFKMGDVDYRELFYVKKKAELTGEYLTDARVTIGNDVQSAGLPVVNFALNKRGARIFSRVTGANLEKRLGIVLDNRVVSAPRIQTKISEGRGVITGIQEMDEAKMLAIVLRVGALPAKLSIMEERTIGPSLGQDSINRGKWSALIGLGLVILFMFFYYRVGGLIADIALLLNFLLLMAVLAQFGFNLTLPGVAGIVLTIGMAVDANVLVFERIREELRTGKTVRASIDAGYSRAFRTIFDANITTLLTALVLYQFGSGPIKGFAVTLSIGIVVSMFTALVVTRVIFDEMTSRRTLKTLSI